MELEQEPRKFTRKENIRILILAIIFVLFGFGTVLYDKLTNQKETPEMEAKEFSASVMAIGGLGLAVRTIHILREGGYSDYFQHKISK